MSDAKRQSLGSFVRQALSGDVPDVATGDLRRIVPLLALPMALEMTMEALFAIVDIYFVARLGDASIAAVGLTEAMLALVYAAAFGLAMPTTAVVARRMGEGSPEDAAVAGAQSIWIGAAIGGLCAIGSLFGASLLALMGAEGEVLEVGRTFTTLSLASSPVVVLLFVNNAILRGAGDATRAMRSLWLANGLNIVLDPCLILGLGPFPELGVTGAAAATLIGRGVGVLYQWYHLYRGPAVTLRGRMAPNLDVAKRILRLSIGGTVQHLVETGSWMVLVRIMAGFGSAAVAGYTVAIRIVIFALLPAWGFSNATATLVGQSLGAGDPDRAERSVWVSGRYATMFLSAVALAFLLAPDWLATVFAGGGEGADVTAAGLFTIGLGFVFYGWRMVSQQAFNGAGDTTTPAIINAICFWCIQLPLAWALAHLAGLGPRGIFIAVASSYSIAAAISVVLVRRGRWKTVEV